MSIKIFGIKNCDTVKKAQKALAEAGVEFEFHDYRKDGIDADMLKGFASVLGWEALLNTRGTTWRKLDAALKAEMNETKAIALMVENDALVKRPVWEKAGDYRLGFAPKDHTAILAWAAS